MAAVIEFQDVAGFLRTETRRALTAARSIPVDAARIGWEFLIGDDVLPVYSGAYKAALTVGLNTLPEIADSHREISNVERHKIVRELGIGGFGEVPTMNDYDDATELFELGDSIIIGNDIRYADDVEQYKGYLISEQAQQIIDLAVERGIEEFNRRSEAATRGQG